MWIRIEFIKDEGLKYISHLDMMRVFERSARRADIRIAYSEGFNPRPKMVFGLPLPLGVIAEKDYADIEIEGDEVSDFDIGAFNQSLPPGLQINHVKERVGKENIMAAVKAAEYLIFVEASSIIDEAEFKKDIRKFKNAESIMVEKERKGKKSVIDIKDMIYDISVGTEPGAKAGIDAEAGANASVDVEKGTGTDTVRMDIPCIRLTVRAGNTDNVRPDLFLKAFNEITGKGYSALRILRTRLFKEENGELGSF